MAKSELDYELDAMLDTLVYTCVFGCGEDEQGRIDMHGVPVFEEMNGRLVMTGVVCRQCWKMLDNYDKE